MTKSFNRLGSETSPYLRQHKDNPVHWWAWGDEAFAAAARENKPVLLSIGYAACHWCHVMAHESFENDAIAALMNRDFINIKVDREERPDVDAIYMKALHMMGQRGGWPLTMFLTPGRLPIWGGTYFPPTARYGHHGFDYALEHTVKIWREQHNDAMAQGEQFRASLAERGAERLRDGLSIEMLNGASEHLLEYVDSEHGGLKGAPKFPMPTVWELVWRAYKRTNDVRFRNATMTTVDRILQGGIYDHLAGGLARYSTDELWLVPHFEKMLYDNALLIELMAEVWKDIRDPLLAARTAEIVDWLDREMTGENGAYTAALDADSEGIEGKFYVWEIETVQYVLGPDAELFAQAYEVTEGGNWEHRNVLNRNASRGRDFTADEEQRLAAARQKLLRERARRVRPGRDDKVLADWNGMTVAALVAAANSFQHPAWLARARAVFAAIVKTMSWTDDQGRSRLAHSLCGGRLQKVDLLDDYAQMIKAALALCEVTGDAGYHSQAEAWTQLAIQLFWDEKDGGFFFSPASATDLIVRTRTANDSATPSGNGIMVANLARLYYLTGDDAYRDLAEKTVTAFEVEAIKSFPHGAALLNGFDLLVNAVQAVVIAKPGDPDAAKLRDALAAQSVPNLILQTLADTAALPEHHPAAGKKRVEDRATLYICRGTTCSAPVTDVADVAGALSGTNA